jgi:hypothetical protein
MLILPERMVGDAGLVNDMRNPNEDLRVQTAIDRLASQQCFSDTEGIHVRLSNQNQVFLNTRRPTRVGIPYWLLERMVPGFVVGKKTFLKITCGKATSYHMYNGGQNWVPTVPKSMGNPNDVFDMKIELLTRADFVNSFPRIGMSTKQPHAWMTDWSEIGVSRKDGDLALDVEQHPPIEGIARYSLKGRPVEDLVFQKGSIFAVVELKDVFSVPKFLQLHHDGHRRAWISLNKRKSSRVRLLSFDGFRLRLKYGKGKRYYGTVMYLQDPSQLYSLGGFGVVPEGIEIGWAGRTFFVRGVRPARKLERAIVESARFYGTGRIGAEITYSILSNKLGIRGLVLNEPGRGGPDLQTKDNRILAESRFIVQVEPGQLKAQISRDIAQMTRKIRREFRYISASEVGYAVISFLKDGEINSLVVELLSPR